MKLDPSPTRPDRIYFRTRLDPNVNGIDHSLQPRIGPEKSRGPADLAAAPLLSFSLFTY